MDNKNNSASNPLMRKNKKNDSRKSGPDGHLNIEESLSDLLGKLISDHKSLFEQYRTYTREADKLFGKYVLMVEALKQEHETLKQLLQCEESDPLYSKKKKKEKEELLVLLEKEACIVRDISNVLEQIKRTQLATTEKEKILISKKIGLSRFFVAAKVRFQRVHYLEELEYEKYQSAVQFNSSIVENNKLREEIDDIKSTRTKYENSYKHMLKQIEIVKNKKKKLLEEAQQAIEDKDTTISMINAILSGNKKEDDLYQQKIESMKQMIRYDVKATDFLVRKLNERSDLKAIESERRLEELKETLDAENKILAQQKEALEAIQDVTEEREGIMMVHAYNQKEADKMALFNYIADLNGELTHLKQKHSSLLKEIEELKKDDITAEENYNSTMHENELKYRELIQELQLCDKQSVQMNTTMEIIKHFIECTFKELGCDLSAMESKLGLDMEINPRNMNTFLSEIEVEVARLIQSYQYAKRLKSLQSYEHLKDEAGQEVIKQTMKVYEPMIPYVDDSENYKSPVIPPSVLAIPNKDAADSVSSDTPMTRALNKTEIEAIAKKEMISRKMSVHNRSKMFLRFN